MYFMIKIVCHALAVSCNIQDVTNIQEEPYCEAIYFEMPFNENNNLTILLNKNKN
jgi:hypothetical protein